MRFRTKRQFWSYCGLGIVMRSSSDWIRKPDGGWTRGEVKQTRGLNLNLNRTLKCIFKGAATTVIMQLETEPLHQDYQRLIAAGTKPNLAKVTLARKSTRVRLFELLVGPEWTVIGDATVAGARTLRPGESFVDDEGQVRRAYGAGFALIRPDGYVAVLADDAAELPAGVHDLVQGAPV